MIETRKKHAGFDYRLGIRPVSNGWVIEDLYAPLAVAETIQQVLKLAEKMMVEYLREEQD